MSHVKIKKLKYPLWLNIVFLILTVVVPIGLFIYEGCCSKSSSFRITFLGVITLVIVWIFINKFILKNYKIKLLTKQQALEHDYSIDNGNPEKIRYLWSANEKLLYLFNIIDIIVFGGLGALAAIGISNRLMEIKGVILIMASVYVVAYTMKFIFLMSGKEVDDEGDY